MRNQSIVLVFVSKFHSCIIIPPHLSHCQLEQIDHISLSLFSMFLSEQSAKVNLT
jgi:hypothetical protein